MKQFFSVAQLPNGNFFTPRNPNGTPQIRTSVMFGPTDPDPARSLRMVCHVKRCPMPQHVTFRVVSVELLVEDK